MDRRDEAALSFERKILISLNDRLVPACRDIARDRGAAGRGLSWPETPAPG